MIAKTPEPPYYAVIFTSERSEVEEGYSQTADRMVELASQQPGFLGVESARNEIGITVSYWKDLESIKNWKMDAEHTIAREKGRIDWYNEFKVRIAKVERDYDFTK
ncbi:antibiotic biosynthesis monooxygenase [Flavobacterium enshiense DK69]|uniref:JEMB protein n=1 Tax=Flavobacterium enshiense DK69 TaxID=1107311 RepID=V6S6Y3_9FLAO|nr:antibiotic biosynthesis monooxygenase [Flavobacterium enshiense]ESU22416.1 antibiotic biosynthesis monooxygenase [Flavobacterium enshiense DK69]KGO97418.1 JEMB protein [Flavobacterium enshiense DK69]